MNVESVRRLANTEGNVVQEEIALNAVYSSDPNSVNAQWSKWTPSASLRFTVSNPDAFNKVLPGQFYFIDLIPTDKDGV